MRNYHAHTRENFPPEQWESLKQHLEEVASLASSFGAKWGCEETGSILGLFHDLGKYSKEFQAYLYNAGMGNEDKKNPSKVDHSTAGAQLADSLGPAGKLLAYCLAGHHAGLPNGMDETVTCSAKIGQ